MTEIRAKETQETYMHLLGGVKIWMRMRTLCDVRRTSVIYLVLYMYVPGTKHLFGVDDFLYLLFTRVHSTSNWYQVCIITLRAVGIYQVYIIAPPLCQNI